MRADRPVRRHLSALRRAGAAATLGVVLTPVLTAASTPAAAAAPAYLPAATTYTVRPILDCVIVENDTVRAVFGYTNTGSTVTIAVNTTSNYISPATMNGRQPTRFLTGTYHGAFATPTAPLTTTFSWKLGTTTVSARSSSTKCGPGVTLPTEGNGVGPILVLVVSVIVSMGLGALRTWRHRRRQRVVRHVEC